VAPYRPLSSRGKPDKRFDEPQSGIPVYMRDPIAVWITDFLWTYGSRGWGLERELLHTIQLALRLNPPFRSSGGERTILNSVLSRLEEDDELTLNVIDFLLALKATKPAANDLHAILILGGSEWEVSQTHEDQFGKFQLTRRTLGPVRESIDKIRSDSQRAHHHLVVAWGKLAGRNPDPSTAYREAVRAVEAVAKPVISPNNKKATLGTLIGDLRSTPARWTVTLESADSNQVADLAAMIWTSQLDRHGTDDESAPLSVSQEEADAALYLALGLVRLFSGGHIKQA
jgi:hypothetical protein